MGEHSLRTRLREAVTLLEEVVRAFDASAIGGGADALEALDLFVRARLAAGAGEAVAVAQVDALGAYRDRGQRSAAHLLADRAGITLSAAHDIVDTGILLEDCPATADALRVGQVSVEQAAVVAAAAAVVPDSEAGLLGFAQREPMARLRDKARDVRLAAEPDPEARHRRQHAARTLTHGQTKDGMIWGRFELPPDLGTAVVNRLERQADREFKQASRDGRRESHDRYVADALVTLVTSDEKPTRSSIHADVSVHIGIDTLVTGEYVEGEVVPQILGRGPVPVSVVRKLARDAFVKGVLVDGTEVKAVRHFGRHIPAVLRTALEVRAVLTDGDIVCGICGATKGLERDHVDELADGGATELANLQWRCRCDHRDKSRERAEERARRKRSQPRTEPRRE